MLSSPKKGSMPKKIDGGGARGSRSRDSQRAIGRAELRIFGKFHVRRYLEFDFSELGLMKTAAAAKDFVGAQRLGHYERRLDPAQRVRWCPGE